MDSSRDDTPYVQQPGPYDYSQGDQRQNRPYGNYSYAPINTQVHSGEYPMGESTRNSNSQWPQYRDDDDDPLLQVENDLKPPQHFLGFSIFVALCCCLPLGVAAIVYSSRAMQAIGSREYSKAKEKARTAKNLAISGLVLGIIILASNIVIWMFLYRNASNEMANNQAYYNQAANDGGYYNQG